MIDGRFRFPCARHFKKTSSSFCLKRIKGANNENELGRVTEELQ